MLKMILAYPFILEPLSEVRSVETLRRHAGFASERGFPDVAAEYLAEVERRAEPQRQAA